MPKSIKQGAPFRIPVNGKIYTGYLGPAGVYVSLATPNSVEPGGANYLGSQQEGTFEYQPTEKTYKCIGSSGMNEQIQAAIVAKLTELIP